MCITRNRQLKCLYNILGLLVHYNFSAILKVKLLSLCAFLLLAFYILKGAQILRNVCTSLGLQRWPTSAISTL